MYIIKQIYNSHGTWQGRVQVREGLGVNVIDGLGEGGPRGVGRNSSF